MPVVPGQTVTVDLEGATGGDLPADYDLALYGDIGQTFDRISSGGDAAASALQGADPTSTQVPEFPDEVQAVPTKETKPALPGPSFAPRAYAPRAYAPRAYAPRAYAPRAYAPRAYAPQLFTGSGSTGSSDGFRNAFTAAQSQSLISVASLSGRHAETLSARTGNTDGYYYVRVQGHDVGDFSEKAFRVTADTTGGADCVGLQRYDGTDGGETAALALTPEGAPSDTDPRTVVVTDTSRIGTTSADEATAYAASLTTLAGATDGVVLDLAESPRIVQLWDQASSNLGCPYAVNLVAAAADQLVEQYQQGDARYVVVAGGDDVVPFFRYPDVSGLGQEKQFEDTMKPETAAGESLRQDQVLGQDAYGTQTEVTVGGAVFPVPDLAVGRLVKNPGQIEATIAHFIGTSTAGAPTVTNLPTPTSSLVTGYDFLADAATAMNEEFRGALGPDAPAEAADTLIDPPGTPYKDPGGGDSGAWTATDLADKLDTRHSLTYLAGHFSANDTLAADFDTTLSTTDLEEGVFSDSLVMSAGCHSGYSIVDEQAGSEDTYDWSEAMADQKAVLVAGTGYQYGDTEFLEYSERLYLDLARNLRRGTAGTAVPVGEALADAKRDYLASLTSVSGIDQKVVLQATMYGLPMVGLDAPGRNNPGDGDANLDPAPVSTGPGTSFGLATAPTSFEEDLTRDSRPRPADLTGTGTSTDGLPQDLTWFEDDDGVTVEPGAPVLPKRIADVSVGGKVLRGVGFTGGTYTDTDGVLPLTGAPGIEGSTSFRPFVSDTFWPQRPWSVNYFNALGRRDARSRTALIVNRAQYRSDAVGSLTNTERTWDDLDLKLFYSNAPSGEAPSDTAYQAASPAISDVTATENNGTVTFSVVATGDPAAGVQKVWVTWTGAPGNSGHGTWTSVDLVQDELETTRWTGTTTLPDGQPRSGVRFLVQAANGVGAVSLDGGDGDGYRVRTPDSDDAGVALALPASPTSYDDLRARVTDSSGGGVEGRTVAFTLTRGDLTLGSTGTTGADGRVSMPAPIAADLETVEKMPSGAAHLRVDLAPLLGSTFQPSPATAETDLVIGGATLMLTPAAPDSAMTRAGTAYSGGTTATVADARGPVPGAVVTFTFPESGPRAGFPVPGSPAAVTSTWTGRTGATGVVTAPTPRAGSVVGGFELAVSTPGAGSATRRHTAQYAYTAFGSPVSKDKVSTRATGTVPLKVTALDAASQKISDAEAAALVAAEKVRVSWVRTSGRVGSARGSTDSLTRYLADKDFFQADLKPSSLGWGKGTYQVQLVVLDQLPAAPGMPPLHLGASRVVSITVS